jgi:hypothetical protein
LPTSAAHTVSTQPANTREEEKRTAVAALAVHLLGLHLLVDEPEGVDVAREVAEHGEQDVDEQVAAAAGDERGRCGREEDGDLDNVSYGTGQTRSSADVR